MRLPSVVTKSLLLLPVAIGAVVGQGMPMRPDVSGWQAALSSDHALATEAGAAVLRAGGNAIDAAVTMAGVLSVVRPHMNGVGGDAFVLYREARTGKVYAVNGSGAAGSKATPAFFAEKKLTSIPSTGIMSVSVPGAVRLWQDVLAKFGTIPLAKALAPGIEYASKGYVVSNRLSADIDASRRTLAADPEMARAFLVDGQAPKAGTILKATDLAATLRAIATQGPDALYKGAIAAKIVAFMEKEGGLLTAPDLAKHVTGWQDPIETTYLGRRVLAFPPNTQGVTLLQQLNLAELADLKTMGFNSTAYIHTLVEGSKLAYADRDRYVADPAFAKVPVDMLISKEHAKELRAKIGEKAGTGNTPDPAGVMIRDGDGDTVYLCVVDKDGNAVSWIQSNFAAFGSGRMVPGTGIVLHNRGSLYSLDPTHPNILVPGKRPYHTLAPAMVLNADRSLYMVIGTPGGDGQTQTITQVLNNVAMFGMTPQQAVEAPRWRSYGTRLGVEPGITVAVRDALTARGHTVAVQEPSADFGGIQAILLLPSGARMVGSDFRREAYGIAW
jgi:gamma-glutamyltranspeptidase/glutathione hydrolase